MKTVGTRRFKPYPAYKDSGVPWLGEIPAHWEVKPLRWALSVRSGEALDNSEFELTRAEGLEVAVIGGNGVMGYTNRANTGTACIAIGRVGALCGNVHMVDPPAWITDNALVASHIRGFDRPYLALLLLVLDLNRWASQNAQPLITGGFVKAQRVCTPPIAEQRAIAAFLDRETARIDARVAKKELLIELLQEKRTALITRAVTKGLDPQAPLKDSGVEWLEEIPAHWEVKKWRYCCHVTEGQVAPDDERFRERILIAPNHIESGTGRILYTETADEQGAISGKYLVEPGDIIYSKIRPALNKVCIAGGHWLCSADMYPVAITEKRLTAKFLLYFMLSEPFVRLMVDESMRVAMPKVNREKLAACPLIIPSPDEQRAIATFLDRETAKIDALVAKVREAIERLKELRTALISAAVTGKIDVREEAAA